MKGKQVEGVITRYATAGREGDLQTLIDCYDEDIVAHYGGQSPFAGTHVGRDRFLEVDRAWSTSPDSQ